jgi:phosphoribosylaminoimidazole carboxylase PurE protein
MMPKRQNKSVLIVMGSDSDHPIMREAADILDEFDVGYDLRVSSAHRSPKRTTEIVEKAARGGVKVIIAGAGAAAHLAGVIASHTTLPVIGVPIDSSPLNGMDALLSTLQMPAGIPVATMAVGKAGARNAGILAVQILAVADPALRAKLGRHKKKLARGVEEKERNLLESTGG